MDPDQTAPMLLGLHCLQFRTLVACQKGLDKYHIPRSDCFFSAYTHSMEVDEAAYENYTYGFTK